jgi:hypothetical protein
VHSSAWMHYFISNPFKSTDSLLQPRPAVPRPFQDLKCDFPHKLWCIMQIQWITSSQLRSQVHRNDVILKAFLFSIRQKNSINFLIRYVKH